MKEIFVVAAIIENDNKILCMQRDVGKYEYVSLKWEFPGGKIENNEETKCAIVREMQEEFNTTVTVGEKIAETTFTHHNENVLLSAYAVSFEHDGMDKKFDLTEHTEYKWVNVETIPTLDFVDSDLKIYPQVLDYINKNK